MQELTLSTVEELLQDTSLDRTKTHYLIFDDSELRIIHRTKTHSTQTVLCTLTRKDLTEGPTVATWNRIDKILRELRGDSEQ